MKFFYLFLMVCLLVLTACPAMQFQKPQPQVVQAVPQPAYQSKPLIVTGPAHYNESYLLPYRYAPSGLIHFEKRVWKSTGDPKARFIIIYLDEQPAAQFTFRIEER